MPVKRYPQKRLPKVNAYQGYVLAFEFKGREMAIVCRNKSQLEHAFAKFFPGQFPDDDKIGNALLVPAETAMPQQHVNANKKKRTYD